MWRRNKRKPTIKPSISATGIPTPTPILADIGKPFACGAGLGTGMGTIVGVLVGVELGIAEAEELAGDVELAELEDEADKVDADSELLLLSR